MKIQKLGVQLYTIREFLDTPEHVRESFRRLKDLGYDQAQTAGCQIPYEEFGRIAREENLEIVGTHDKFDLMVEDFEQAYENHMHLGTKNMGIGGFGAETVEIVEKFIEDANKVAARIAGEGIHIDAVKKAEDEDCIILRFHECYGGTQKIAVTSDFGIKDFTPCNLLEDSIGDTVYGDTIARTVKPFEICCYKIHFSF